MRTIILALSVCAAFLTAAPIDAASPDDRGESGAPNESPSRTLPPIVVSVHVASNILPSTVSRLLAEAADVWRPTASRLSGVRDPARATRPTGRPANGGRCPCSTLRVSIDDDRGVRVNDALTPLGWIRFNSPDEPEQVIHLSYANASSLLEASELVVGTVGTMPRLERELYLARAMGRALAHELGHYLLASKAHTPRGLMQTGRSASELFGRQRVHFDLDVAQKQLALSRLTQTEMLTRR